MSKYTPGPWTVSKIGDLFEVRSESECISICRGSYWDEKYEGESCANANLIAAAPEMLEALEHITEYWNQDANETAMADALWHIIETAEIAIAKAKGEL